MQDTPRHHFIQLVFEKSYHLLVELEHKAYWAIETLNFDLKVAGGKWFLQLYALDEIWLEVYENSLYTKRKPRNGMTSIS